MADTTFEEAKRCPKCRQPGKEGNSQPLPRGHGTMHVIYCENKLCIWYGDVWFVQTMPDGSIPDRTKTQGPPQFKPMSNDQLAYGQRVVEDAVKRDLRDS